jgi:hypothetical protein
VSGTTSNAVRTEATITMHCLMDAIILRSQ